MNYIKIICLKNGKLFFSEKLKSKKLKKITFKNVQSENF